MTDLDHQVKQGEEYDVIYADPPWSYDAETTAPNREIENHYSTMDLEEIKAMDVPADDEAVLFLWATAPKLEEALSVVEAWGFEYRTNIVWDKMCKGLGHWARIQHELLLIGRRGKFPTPDTGQKPDSVIQSKRGEHSKKPRKVRRIIDDAYPDASKIELFARDSIAGWDVWGDEAPDTTQQRLVPAGGSSD